MTVHFDTNGLIQISLTTSLIGKKVLTWLKAGNNAAVSTIAWSEFCNGPLASARKNAISAILDNNTISFTKPMAELASLLFNAGGRRRGSHSDCMIAACAIVSSCPLATINTRDFEPFVPMGLKLHVF